MKTITIRYKAQLDHDNDTPKLDDEGVDAIAEDLLAELSDDYYFDDTRFDIEWTANPDEALLGHATTRELIDELIARCPSPKDPDRPLESNMLNDLRYYREALDRSALSYRTVDS